MIDNLNNFFSNKNDIIIVIFDENLFDKLNLTFLILSELSVVIFNGDTASAKIRCRNRRYDSSAYKQSFMQISLNNWQTFTQYFSLNRENYPKSLILCLNLILGYESLLKLFLP